MITVFNVVSDRIHDIELEPGTTVAQLRKRLADGGYDVAESMISVNRHSRGDILIGHNDRYALQPGDTVEFKTRKVDFPALSNAINKLDATAKAERAAEEWIKAPCCARHWCSAPAAPKSIAIHIQIVKA